MREVAALWEQRIRLKEARIAKLQSAFDKSLEIAKKLDSENHELKEQLNEAQKTIEQLNREVESCAQQLMMILGDH